MSDMPPLKGSVLIVMLYYVCEEIRLEELHQKPGAQTAAPALKTGAPERIRFVRPPVVEPLEISTLEGGEALEGQIKYYDYGVVSVIFELAFVGEWQTLVERASHWIWETEFDRHALSIARLKLERATQALIKPYPEWLNEDYFITGAPRYAPLRRALRFLRGQSARCADRILKASRLPRDSQPLPALGRMTWLSSDGTARSSMTPRRAPRPPGSYSNTLIPSSWSSATTTNC